MPEDNIEALEGTPEHGWVKVSRKWLLWAVDQFPHPEGYHTSVIWGKPDEDGFYSPRVSLEPDDGLDQKLVDTFDDESPAVR